MMTKILKKKICLATLMLLNVIIIRERETTHACWLANIDIQDETDTHGDKHAGHILGEAKTKIKIKIGDHINFFLFLFLFLPNIVNLDQKP